MSGQDNVDERSVACRAVIGLVQRGSDDGQSSPFSPDVSGWLASPEQGTMFEVDRVLGAPEVSGRLASLGPRTVEVLGAALDEQHPNPVRAEQPLNAAPEQRPPGPAPEQRRPGPAPDERPPGTVREERHWWAELTLGGKPEPETCIVQCTLDRDDRITQVVWLRARAVTGGGGRDDAWSGDARPKLEGYFADLQASRFDRAAERFAAEGIYSHPPYRPGGDRVLWLGRDAIRDGFTHERGESPVRQLITDAAQSGHRAFIRGVVEGVPNGGGGSFVSTAEFTEAGEIMRYVAFYSAVRF